MSSEPNLKNLAKPTDPPTKIKRVFISYDTLPHMRPLSSKSLPPAMTTSLDEKRKKRHKKVVVVTKLSESVSFNCDANEKNLKNVVLGKLSPEIKQEVIFARRQSNL